MGAPTARHRVTGLRSSERYGFQVRALTVEGPRDPYEAVKVIRGLRPGDLIPWASGYLESGRTFATGDIAFTVPPGMRMLIADRYYQRYADGEEYSFKVLLDVESGSWLALNPDTGEYTDRYVTPEGHRRGVDALLAQIVASTRCVPAP